MPPEPDTRLHARARDAQHKGPWPEEADRPALPTQESGQPRPLKVTRRDDDLGCNVRRVVGYVATCPECGEKMPTCSTVQTARLALEMHELHRHGT